MTVKRPGYIPQIPKIFLLSSYQVAEMRKVQCAGGTLQGEANPSWLKQPSDRAVAALGFTLTGIGLIRVSIGLWRLATGKGKIED